MENKKKSVSIYTDEKEHKWIRIRTFDQDFLIDTEDIVIDGKNLFKWDKLMRHVNAGKLDIPSKKQWSLVEVYKEEVDELLDKEGFPKMIDLYWSKSLVRSYFDDVWLFCGNVNCLSYNLKDNRYYGRALAYPKC